MTFNNPSNKELYDILDNTKTIAVVGASANSARASHGVMKILQRVGYKIIPVNPGHDEILGETSYPSLSEIPSDIKIDMVNVFRRPEYTPAVAEEAVARGADYLWLQLGIANDEAASIAKAGGLDIVMDKCIAVVHGQLDVPVK